MGALRMSVTDEAWRADAACLGMDTGAFYPDSDDVFELQEVCDSCPVRLDCLEFALAHGERFGVWGGLGERKRRMLRGAHPKACEGCGKRFGQRTERRSWCDVCLERRQRHREQYEGLNERRVCVVCTAEVGPTNNSDVTCGQNCARVHHHQQGRGEQATYDEAC